MGTYAYKSEHFVSKLLVGEECLSMRTMLFSTQYGTQLTPNTQPRIWCTWYSRAGQSRQSTIFALEAAPLHQNHGIAVSPFTELFREFRELEMLEMRARCSVGFLSTNGWQTDWSFTGCPYPELDKSNDQMKRDV